MPNGFALSITYSDLHGRWPTSEDLAACLKPYRLPDVILTLSWILSVTESWRGVTNNERDLILRRYFAPSLRYRGPGLDDRFLFSRATLLWLMRQAFLLCPPEGAAMNTPEAHQAIGEAALIANDLGSLRKPRRMSSEMDFAANLLPQSEYFPHEEFDRDIARTHFMLSELAPVSPLEALRRLPATIEQLLGFSLEEYRDLVLASAMRALSADPSDPRTHDLLSLSPPNFQATSLQPHRLCSFWDSISWAAEDAVREFMRNPTAEWDLTPLRKYPLLRVGDDQHIVLDVSFLFDKVGRSLFWTALDRQQGKRERGLLLENWGHLFEEYVGLVLTQTAHPARRLFIDPRFGNHRSVDFCVLEGRTLIVIEVKSSTIPSHVRYADDPALLRLEIEKKFVTGDQNEKKGVAQIVSFLETFVQGAPFRDLQGARLSVRDTSKIIPVLVHLDPALRTIGVNHYMARRLREMFRAKRPVLTPLAVLDIAELEEIQGHLKDLLLRDILESFLRTLSSDPGAVLHAGRIPLLAGRPHKPGPVLQTFESLFQQTIERLFPGSPGSAPSLGPV